MKYKKYLNWIKVIVFVLWLIGWILRDLFQIPFGKWMASIALTIFLVCIGLEQYYMQNKK